MRVLAVTAMALVLASGGVAMAQVAGQPTAATIAYTVEPYTPAGQVVIQGSGVRLRAEPFATQQTQVLSSGSTGLVLNVVGIARFPGWNWYQVVLKNGQKAFIRSDLTSAPSRGGAQMAQYPAAPQPIATAPTPPATTAPAPTPSAPVRYTPVEPSDSIPIQLAPPPSSGLVSVDPGQITPRPN